MSRNRVNILAPLSNTLTLAALLLCIMLTTIHAVNEVDP
nr:MAG TPA: hypothetical protein [Microviridae sp.]